MRQRIGAKKHALCEQIAGRTYTSCWHRGSWPHGVFDCVHPLADSAATSGPMTSDWVNIRTRTVTPHMRDGFAVQGDEL